MPRLTALPLLLLPLLLLPLLLLLLLLLLPAAAAAAGDEHFDFSATLRVDLHHAGDHRSERFMIDELRREGAWPGSRTRLVDPFRYGSTLAEVYLPGRGGPLIFSQGYCSLFGEWRTSNEALTREKSFAETVRLPWPRSKIRLVMKTRDRRGRFVPVFETTVDPTSREISGERRRGGLTVFPLHGQGEPAQSLDVVILGDGYQRWQMDKFRQDARRYAEVLLASAPFDRYQERINIWAVESPSRHSGVDEPRKGLWRDTALSMSFNTFDSPRYLMTTDTKAVADVAANAPYDAVYIVSNTSRYGGGGIYNLYASFVSDSEYDEYIFMHEFGHSFAGLGDEYYTSAVAYNDMYPRGVEPWEPNITAERRRARIKWAAQIAPETPVPTPAEPAWAGRAGLFEGAGYSAKGLFRPALDCKMFNKGKVGFCPVCLRSTAAMIERYLE